MCAGGLVAVSGASQKYAPVFDYMLSYSVSTMIVGFISSQLPWKSEKTTMTDR